MECIKHLKACVQQVGHPLLLPVIIYSHDLSFKTDIKQREARDWLRRLEHAVSMRTEIQEEEGYVKDGVVDLNAINRDLVECHSQVLWKRPKAYMQLLEAIERAMKEFYSKLPEHRKDATMRKLQMSMLSRMDFFRVKLQGMESYAYTTLQRLDTQRSAVRSSLSLTQFPLPGYDWDSTGGKATDNPPAIQHHRAKRIQTQLPNGRRATQARPRLQTRLRSHENHLPARRHLPPRRLSRLRLLHDLLQFPRR